MDINDIDYSKIYLIPDKRGYRISYNMSKFTIKTPILYIPFGIERYNNKDIINLTIDKSSNINLNFIHFINTLERIYKQFSDKDNNNLPYVKLPPDFINDVCHRDYIYSFKKNQSGYIWRTHLRNDNIYKIENNKKTLIEKKDIINRKCICEIECSYIWLYGTKYGLIWNVINLEIID